MFNDYFKIAVAENLNPSEKILLMIITNYVENLGFKFLSQDKLSEISKLSLSTIKKSLSRLTELKLIDYVDSEFRNGIKCIKLPVPLIDNIQQFISQKKNEDKKSSTNDENKRFYIHKYLQLTKETQCYDFDEDFKNDINSNDSYKSEQIYNMYESKIKSITNSI